MIQGTLVDEFSMNGGENRQYMTTQSAPEHGIDVSVVIPTFNRARQLGLLLKELVNQDAAGVQYEVLVVDNDSTDATRTVVMNAAGVSGRVLYFHEPRRGASNARNRGIEAASAPIIAFIDDDVRPARDWVKAIASAFLRHPEIDCVGGRVEPRWPRQPPAWLTQKHWGPLALQVGRGSAPYVDIEHAAACLITANFACRARVFEEVGGFSPDFLRDEDREFNLRMWKAGKRGKYDDSIVAFADVQPERLEKAYHRRWHRATGRSHARMRFLEVVDRDGRLRERSTGRYLFGAPGFAYRQLWEHLVGWLRSASRGRMDDAFFDECRTRYLLAYLAGRWRSHDRTPHIPASGAPAARIGRRPRVIV